MTDAELQIRIAELESAVPAPDKGLPEPVFEMVTRLTPMINVDLLIQNERGATLLTWRRDWCFRAGWHLPGGIIRLHETAEDRVAAVAALELGTQVEIEAGPIAVNQLIYPGLSKRSHFISLLYRCRLHGVPQVAAAGEIPEHGEWRWFCRMPEDLLEPHKIYEKFLTNSSRCDIVPEADTQKG